MADKKHAKYDEVSTRDDPKNGAIFKGAGIEMIDDIRKLFLALSKPKDADGCAALVINNLIMTIEPMVAKAIMKSNFLNFAKLI